MRNSIALLIGNRLERSIAALDNRISNSAAAIGHLQAGADLQRTAIQSQLHADDQTLRNVQAATISTKKTESDETFNQLWTTFDTQTLKSLQDEKSKVASLRKEAAAELLNLKHRAEKQVADLQAAAKADKLRLHAALETNKDLLAKLSRESLEIQNQCDIFIARRGLDRQRLTIQHENVLESDDNPTFTSIKTKIANEIVTASGQLAKLRAFWLTKFSDSWILWAVAALLAIACAQVAWQLRGELNNVTGFLISFAVFGLTLIIGGILLLLASRPLLRKHVFLIAPEVYAACNRIEQHVSYGTRHQQSTFESRLKILDEKLNRDISDTKELAAINSDKVKIDLKVSELQILQSLAAGRFRSTERFNEAATEVQTVEKATLQKLLHQGTERLVSLRRSGAQQLQTLQASEDEQTAHNRFRIRTAMLKTQERLTELQTAVDNLCPDWKYEPLIMGKNRLGYLPIGKLQLAIGEENESVLRKSDAQTLHQELPLVFQLIEHGTLVIKAHSVQQPQAHRLVRNLILRAFASLPPGTLQVTIIDPDGLGREFSHLMQLADSDPTLVNYRVWTQPTHIAEQLAKLSHHTEDVIQQLLRDRYGDIRAYNAEAGSMAEPFRIVLWSRFPAGVDEASWRYLSSLLSSGGRCGVSTILMVDTDFAVPPMVDMRRLEHAGLTIRIDDTEVAGQARIESATLRKFPVVLDQPPDPQTQQSILTRCAADALRANRVEVPFDAPVPNQLPRYQSNSASGLAIPIGHAGVGRNRTLRLGHGTAQHVLVAGKTGSGKSSFLHTLVTSAAIHYGPDQLRLVLLDFKKGVEFQVYAETAIPHADIIGIESQREFGVSTLEYLDRMMQQRGEAFRNAGVQDVASWCAVRSDIPMPRVLVVVDEFQEIFTEDDKLGQQAAMLLDRIVRQGRSFGIHVVLASQTLGGAYSLPRTTLAQMAVRIALQCEGADAMMILSEDNLAAERLRYAGQAIYNEQSGRIEGNQPFQVAFLAKQQQRTLLGDLDATQFDRRRIVGGLEKCVVFDGHRKAVWKTEAVKIAIESLAQQNPNCPAILLGDSVSIEPVVAVSLFRQAGQNLLMVGTDDENGASVLRSISATFAAYGGRTIQASDVGRKIVLVDASREEDASTRHAIRLIQSSNPDVEICPANSIERAIVQLHTQLQESLADLEHETNGKALVTVKRANVLLVITHLQRLRSLRKNDEFSFGDDGDQPKIDKLFQAILRDGPSVGIHVLLWCDTASTFNRWLPRQSMHDLDFRVLMQMSVNDSNQLIDSAAANRLDKNVLLLHEESSGQSRKFRPYAIDPSS